MSDPLRLEPLPPAEAVAYFEAKGSSLFPTFAWQDFWQEDHAASFTVAKSAGFDILQDVHDSQLAAIAQGQAFPTFRDKLTPILQAKGWWGRQAVTDPATGEPVEAQLGSVARLQTIFNVNMRTSYAAGAWNAATRNKAARPYLRYTAIMDSRTRPAHRAWHGTILPIGHPWWKTHYPPCGWNCRCRAITLSDADLKRYGFEISPEPPADPSPPRLYTNPRTGVVSVVPYGIDPGFAYNPGETAVELHAARVAAAKWYSANPAIAAAEQAASVRFLRPLLTRDFGNWVDDVAARRVPLIGDRRVVGALTDKVLAFLGRRGMDPQSGAVTIDDRAVAHMLRDAKTGRGASLPSADIMRLPDIIMTPEEILFDQEDPALVYIFEGQGAEDGKVIVRVNFQTKDAGRPTMTNAVRTGGIVRPGDLASDRYIVIEAAQAPGGTPLSP